MGCPVGRIVPAAVPGSGPVKTPVITVRAADRERGRIWRISYRGENPQPLQSPPDFTRMSNDELLKRLGDANLTVRTFAANRLVMQEKDKVHGALTEAAKQGANPLQRLHALWVLERRGELSEDLLLAGCTDQEVPVRVHALRVLRIADVRLGTIVLGEPKPAELDVLAAD